MALESLKNTVALFFRDGSDGDDLPDVPEEPLSPREARLRRAAAILRWGAIANGIVMTLVVIVGIVAATQSDRGLFERVHAALLGRVAVNADAALLAALLLGLANASVLLVLLVGTLAQELWIIGGVWLLAGFNVLALVQWGYTPAIITMVPAVWCGLIASRDFRGFRMNPVMLKELRGRMRGVRAAVVMTVYLGLMSGFMVLLYLISTTANRVAGTAVTGDLGRILFVGVVGIELMLIIFIAPAFTAGAITGERERKTYDLLQVTLLPQPSFVMGKLESALSYIVLLLLAAIPLQSIAFLFGGVSETEVLLAFVMLAVTAIALGSLGMFFSSVAQRTLTASVRSYTVALAVTFGLPLLLSVFLGYYSGALTGSGTGIDDSPVLETILIYTGLILASLNPVATSLFSQFMLIEYQEIGFWTATLSSDGSKIPLVAPWITFTIIYLSVSAILIVLSVRRMRRSEGRE